MRVSIISLLFTSLAITFAATASAQESTSFGDAITSGKLIFNLRPRYEIVDQANFNENAEALTNRTLLGWKTASWYGLSATAELISVGRAIDDYNDTLNGKTQYPVIADPNDTDVNQLYLDYRGIQNTLIRGGRQAIKLDNVRFVGNVAFRQVMQVFNGAIIENNSLRNTRLYAGYLGRVKTITTRQFDTDTVLLNGRYSITPDDAVVGYGYFQDQANAIVNIAFQGPAPTDTSNQIIGLQANGAHPMAAQWRLLYTLEYAKQSDYAGGDPRINADYTRIGGGAKWENFTLRIDYEVLGSNNGTYGFQTPLATKHPFQGWVDKFAVATPSQGLRDAYITGKAGIQKAALHAAYHQFEADYGSLDFGDEFDVSVSYPLMKRLVGKIEYADYRAGDPGSGKVDENRLWLTLIFNY